MDILKKMQNSAPNGVLLLKSEKATVLESYTRLMEKSMAIIKSNLVALHSHKRNAENSKLLHIETIILKTEQSHCFIS